MLIREVRWLLLGGLFLSGVAQAQQSGSIGGVVSDKDFEAPLPQVQVLAVETGQKAVTGDQGGYVLERLEPGSYTLVFSKDGYSRQVRADVVVGAGLVTNLDVELSGEFVEMEEFVVQDVLQLGGASEAALLELRFESAALMDSISSDLMSRAGASDAASALRLVAGASVQDGKSAVIRGLPDRYVSSQMNGVRLPTADEDKRAVELDQFPSAVIDSIQVSKTFTPDQQGDASGGAVDVRLKGIPEESLLQFKVQRSTNDQVTGRHDFLTYDGGGVGTWGRDAGNRDPQLDRLGESWDGAVGVSETSAPIDYKLDFATGGKKVLENGVTVGGFLDVFYERDSSFYDNGVDDSYWVEIPGGPMVPKTYQGAPDQGDFKTGLFDITRATQSVHYGGLATFGVEWENHSIGLTYLYTHTAEDSASLAEDTRGKEYFFDHYDPNDPFDPGNESDNQAAAPYLRLETLEYTERSTDTLQLHGEHVLPWGEGSPADWITFRAPELDWTVADSSASLDQPDKRQFGALWYAEGYDPGNPVFGIPPGRNEAEWFPYKPGANFNLGNLQRIWKDITEDSTQYISNLSFPFEQWTGDEGEFKVGVFDDSLQRRFNQDSFSNFGDSGSSYEGGWDDSWSSHFADEDHPITESKYDVDYRGDQDVGAVYAMVDVPFDSQWTLITGARWESTTIGIVNLPEEEALWFPPGANAPVKLNPGDADVDLDQSDTLPAVALVYEPWDQLTLRASYAETIARPTFKELTPILQQEYLGGPVFVGNPDIEMSSVENYDLRADYRPLEGSLLSMSWFRKDIKDPIEYIQRVVGFDFTTAVNYPEGQLDRYEVELRQELGTLVDALDGFSFGANATFIDSEVRLTDEEIAVFEGPGIDAPITTRDMTNAPEHLYNLYLTWDLERTGTQVGLFYTIQGDTLVAGATQSNDNFVPSIYQTEFDTLNLSVTQELGPLFKIVFRAKNLTDTKFQTVYRSKYIGDDVIEREYTTGVEYSLSIDFKVGF